MHTKRKLVAVFCVTVYMCSAGGGAVGRVRAHHLVVVEAPCDCDLTVLLTVASIDTLKSSSSSSSSTSFSAGV